MVAMEYEKTLNQTRRSVIAGIGTGALLGIERVAAISPKIDRRKEWKESFETCLVSPVSVDDHTLHIGFENELVSIDKAGGEQRRVQLDGGHLSKSPTVVGDTIYASTFRQIHAVSSTIGRKKWRFDTGWGGNTKPVIAGDTLYVCRGENEKEDVPGKLFALDTADGRLRWEHTLNDHTWSQPEVFEQTVYTADTSGNIYALDSGTGTERWRYSTESSITSSPIVANSTLFICDRGGNVYALNATDGSLQWKSSAVHPHTGGEPTVNNSSIYISGWDGVHAFDLRSGTKQWEYETETAITPPAMVENNLYYGSAEGKISCFDRETGKHRWRVSLPETKRYDVIFNGVSNRPTSTGSHTYVVTDGGIIYALKINP